VVVVVIVIVGIHKSRIDSGLKGPNVIIVLVIDIIIIPDAS
jgi:hypothetical protein